MTLRIRLLAVAPGPPADTAFAALMNGNSPTHEAPMAQEATIGARSDLFRTARSANKTAMQLQLRTTPKK
jgi:hypothetical protein